MNERENQPGQRGQLDRLAAQFIQELRTEAPVSIESYAERHPQWADEIRQRFPALLEKEKNARSG